MHMIPFPTQSQGHCISFLSVSSLCPIPAPLSSADSSRQAQKHSNRWSNDQKWYGEHCSHDQAKALHPNVKKGKISNDQPIVGEHL